MSNFISTFLLGKEGKNLGLPTGIVPLDQAINGIQKGKSYGLAAAQKVGKTTLADFSFVLSPYLYSLKSNSHIKTKNINWIYFSYEIARVSKEYKYAAFFMAHDFGVWNFMYKDKLYLMNQDYLTGAQLHNNGDGTTEQIPITKEHEDILKVIYTDRIVPIFGEYDIYGKKIRQGKIDFIEDTENPTGIWKYLMNYAKANGEFIFEDYETTNDTGAKEIKKRISGYTEKNPDLYTIIIVDHIRKLRRERGFTLKENIDKWLEYSTILRNICKFTFLNICHSNRQVSNIDRLKFAGEYIYPTADDVKDSGNLSEESSLLLTMFNANDEKYSLNRHFGVDLISDGKRVHPDYRSIHIAESRYTPSPAHIQARMLGGVNMFLPLN